MTIDLKLFGSKVRQYREQFELSRQEISLSTGIDETTLVAFEKGEQKPTGSEILILTDYFKCNDYQFFLSDEQLAPFEQTKILFRLYGDELSKEDRWAIQEFLFLCECEEFLLQHIPKFSIKPFTFEKRGAYYKGHGEEAAFALRRQRNYEFHQVPMDIYDDFRRIGLHVFRRQLGNSKISGLYIKHPIAGKCVLVNYNEDMYRQRFTVAHEAGHAILDDDQEVVVSFVSWSKEQLSEIRAETFASHYLIPPEFLQKIPNPHDWNHEKALEWAKKFKVSTSALAKALQEANLIPYSTRKNLKAIKVPYNEKSDTELSDNLATASLERKKEALKRGLSNFYVALCFDAYEQKIVSYGRLAEMLLVDEQDLQVIAEIYKRTLTYDCYS